ncbi:MAG: hypothetical protein J3Q66DRAFT_341774 [Benniella sp.]|nr:MAG: hypothetical protein J3Q66DRAFT_341774 [Benniella sp.]
MSIFRILKTLVGGSLCSLFLFFASKWHLLMPRAHACSFYEYARFALCYHMGAIPKSVAPNRVQTSNSEKRFRVSSMNRL